MDPIYLGDGVYLTHDGYQAKLYTTDGKNETNTIYLDDNVIDVLIEELKELRERRNGH